MLLSRILAFILVLLLMEGLAASMSEVREVPASNVSAKIEAGEPAEFENCIIVGDLYLGGLKIDGAVHFKNTLFQNSVSFESTTFNSTVFFEGSTFNHTADFMYSTFNGDARFKGSAFNGDAYFLQSKFKGLASFDNSSFNGDANFWNSSFYADAFFGNSSFNGSVTFADITFNGFVSFIDTLSGIGSRFNKVVSFSRSTFKSDAEFSNSSFSDAIFVGSTFNGAATFDDCRFNRTKFSYSQFSKEARFNDAEFNNTTIFTGSRFKEDALFEGTNFNCTLYLIRTKYEKLYIRWKNIKDLAYDDAAYLSLMENFKKLGYLEDYDNCYYEYRVEHRDQSWGGGYHGINPVEEWIRKRIDFGLEVFYGYGRSPLLPLLWSIGTVFFFGAIWWIGGLKGQTDTNQMSILEKYSPGTMHVSRNRSRGKHWKHGLYVLGEVMIFSATVFLSGTRLFIEPPDLPEMPRWTEFQTRVAFTAERVLGAFFSILFFIAISATVVR